MAQTVSEKRALDLVFFHMQGKEMYNISPQLCRVARQEWEDLKDHLPDEVKADIDFSFYQVLRLVEHLEKSEFAKAMDILQEAYKEYQDMIGYFPYVPRAVQTQAPDIYDRADENARAERNGDMQTVIGFKKEGQGDNLDWSIPAFTTRESVSRSTHVSRSEPEESGRRQYFLQQRAREGNPELVDIHDLSTPSDLAQRFNSLYTDHWRPVFDELSKVVGDKQAIRHLLWVVAKASNICVLLAAQQLDDIENSVTGIMTAKDPLNKAQLMDALTEEMVGHIEDGRKVLVEYRKALAMLSSSIVKTEMRRAIAAELGPSLPRKFSTTGNQFVEYAELCVELVWLMYVQDPPMYIEWLTRDQEGTPFKTEIYTIYTRPGQEFDYCVWPALRVHRDGPVIAKGVAQGR